jgi:predicted  nucleic acid-binding Zn-ribbon protein
MEECENCQQLKNRIRALNNSLNWSKKAIPGYQQEIFEKTQELTRLRAEVKKYKDPFNKVKRLEHKVNNITKKRKQQLEE